MTEFRSIPHHTVGQTSITTSVIVPVGETIELVDLPRARPHNFLGIELFSKANGTPTVATGGSVDLEVTTWANPQGTDSLSVSTIDVTALRSLSWSGNTKSVTVSPNAIVGATHWRVTIVSNIS